MRAFYDLTKMGIVIFVILSATAGYALNMPVGQPYNWHELAFFLLGIYLLSSGSFTINQAQEWLLDRQMNRTAKRPIPKGTIKPWQAWLIGIILSVSGLMILFVIKPLVGLLGLATLALYNGIYTLFWKRRWAFGAVPGAIPGAMPGVIGYAVHSNDLFTPDCFYLFMILFLWQMPHFWTLAIRFKEDYAQGGFPVLPRVVGVSSTIYHIGLYTFAYVALAVASPWFVHAKYMYLLVVLPLSGKVLYEFFKFVQDGAQKKWLPFFLWVNASVIAFIFVPVLDKWLHFSS